jgi:hypothetical protein
MAVGLLWQPKTAGESLRAQAKSASVGDATFDLSVFYANGAQIGFASKLEAYKSGMVAAATAFPREMTGDTWLGAFVMPITGDQGQLVWWIVAHRDRLVYEDRIIRNELEARESFIELHDAPGWQVVVCPSNWQVTGSSEIQLGYMLPSATKGAQLKSHELVQVWGPRAAIAAVFLGAAFGGYSYWQSVLEAQRLAEEARLAALQVAQPPAPIVPPWEGMPDMDEFAYACAALINSVIAYPTGWLQDPVTCNAEKGMIYVTATWRRQSGGRAAWIFATLSKQGLSDFQLDETRQVASVSVSAALAAHDWGEVEPLDPAEMVTRLGLRFDTLSLPLTLTAQPPAPPPPPVNPGQLPPPVWNFHVIEFESSTFVTSQIDLLNDIPAVVPRSITYSPDVGLWKLVANIYHPPTMQTI